MKNHVRFDRTKQNIVDLIVPHFKDKDRGLKRRSSSNVNKNEAPIAQPQPKKQKTEEETKRMPKLLMVFELRAHRATHKGDAKVAEMKGLNKPWIRTSPKITVKHLKKYLALKLASGKHEDFEVTCQDEVLGTDHTLDFIKKTRWHENSNLVLHYRLKNR